MVSGVGAGQSAAFAGHSVFFGGGGVTDSLEQAATNNATARQSVNRCNFIWCCLRANVRATY
jgi:hypothetical protein